jgi:AcrR family transcriptional regulator
METNNKRVQKKKAIIDNAGRLISKKGIENTSLSDIAHETGISKGTLYYYYATRNDLIFDIAVDHIERISNDLFTLIDRIKGPSSPETVLTAMVETILKAETRSRLHLYLIREALTENKVLEERFIETYQHWFKTMEQGLEKILPGQSDLEVLAAILVAVLDGLVIQSMLRVQNIMVKDIVRYLLKMAR